MPVKVVCPNPNCKAEYRVAQDRLGKSGTCSKCGLKFALQISAGGSVGGRQAAGVELPARIGQYQIKRLLGAGAMGRVYLAYDPHLDRDVAIKVLSRELSDDERGGRFLREARLAAKIQHPNTVVIHQVMVEEGLASIVMELLEGGSLEDTVHKHGAMPWREASRTIRDAAAGLGAAHEMGLVHRDVNPTNLMRTCKGTVKVADFGLVRAMQGASQLTQPGAIMGTPAFMAPEQWMGQEADARSDLYSLACTYYYLLTGKEPFVADTLPALGYLHCHEPFPDAGKLVPDLPPATRRILARGTKKAPGQRFQTAAELITALDELLAMPPAALNEFSPMSAAALDELSALPPAKLSVGATAGAKVLAEHPAVKPQAGRATGESRLIRNTSKTAIPSHLRTPGRMTAAAAGLGGIALLLGVVIYMSTGGGAIKNERRDPQGKEISVDLGGGVKMELILIPAGEFTMGSPESDNNARDEEKPQHQVRISRPFYLGKYLVTQEQWESLMGNSPSDSKGTKNPVEFVSWDDVQVFLDRLNAKSGGQGGKYLLPTEAQWEYACRAGSEARYSFGEDEGQIGEYAWYDKNSGHKTHPVGTKKPNAWNLYDMHGNVWEWCQDWYGGGYYADSPPDDPPGPATGLSHVVRGGDWNGDAKSHRSALRGRYTPENRRNYLGFRVARVAADK
jgi:formylglycine-generating enzyme required for sulfatase activity/serine/threonine protein kinase